jgi:hypothetical protein
METELREGGRGLTTRCRSLTRAPRNAYSSDGNSFHPQLFPASLGSVMPKAVYGEAEARALLLLKFTLISLP